MGVQQPSEYARTDFFPRRYTFEDGNWAEVDGASADGTAVILADPESTTLIEDECKRCAQAFVDQMPTWEETIAYGDWQSHHKFESVRGRLHEALKARIKMHDYKRGAGCPRCPQA
jgi:hypothetical protein